MSEKPNLEMRPLAQATEKSQYILPTFSVGENGLEPEGEMLLQFVKGNKADASAYRQDGITTESLLHALKDHLQFATAAVPSEIGEQTLHHVSEALRLTIQRRIDRENRGVLGTYEK